MSADYTDHGWLDEPMNPVDRECPICGAECTAWVSTGAVEIEAGPVCVVGADFVDDDVAGGCVLIEHAEAGE